MDLCNIKSTPDDDSSPVTHDGLILDITTCDISIFRASEIALDQRTIYFLRTPCESSMIDNLIDFHERLRDLSPNSTDPNWFVFNFFGARFGMGSKALLSGVPVDPRCNPVHRYSMQYIADMGLLGICSSYATQSLIAVAVSYLCERQDGFNKSALAYAKCQRLVIISITNDTVLRIGELAYPVLYIGEICVVSLQSRKIIGGLRLESGAAVAVVFGTPEPYSNTKGRAAPGCYASGFASVNAKIELESAKIEGVITGNRKTSTKGLFQSKLACPDCRRPLEIRKSEPSQEYDLPNFSNAVFVTVVCDESETENAVKIASGSQYSDRIVFVTDTGLVSDKLRGAFEVRGPIASLQKHRVKRGIHDYCVEEGFVTPIIFPKTADPPIKDTMYTMIQALGDEVLWGRRVRISEPDGSAYADVIPSERMYKELKMELKDWNHPCHRARRSATGLIREWWEVYG